MSLLFWRKNDKLSKQVREILRITQKVIHYRKDLLSENALNELAAGSIAVSQALQEEDQKKTETQIVALEKLLRKYGGKIYPQGSLGDNVETIIVGLLLLVSLRAFFIQNFKIPTNSMYPSFGGMVPEVFTEAHPEPNPLMKVARKVLYFASNYSVEAESSGELIMVLEERPTRSGLYHVMEKGRKLMILPAVVSTYEFQVNGKSHFLKVPADLDMYWVLAQRFGKKQTDFQRSFFSLQQKNKIIDIQDTSDANGFVRKIFIKTGIQVKEGEDILNFDVITGDMLFVDRFTYHFRSPKVGEPIVFPTKNMETIDDKDKYYIKRMVAEGGDVLQVHEPVLYRNGKPIEGHDAFQKNAAQEGEFEGYLAVGQLAPGNRYELPSDTVYAMGDNSDNSQDSRYFGPVPRKEVIGKAVFVYYPFTSRWGPAK